MNRYVHAVLCAGIGFLKFNYLKILRGKSFCFAGCNLVSPRTEITIDRGGTLKLGKMTRIRSNAKLRVRAKATVTIGNNFSMSNQCMVVAHERVEIGDNVQLGPGVLIYDHDHDYLAPGGLAAELYKTTPVKIGNNVWIGANAIILRGSIIGDNSVVAAGTVVKGEYKSNSLIYQERSIKVKEIGMNISHDGVE